MNINLEANRYINPYCYQYENLYHKKSCNIGYNYEPTNKTSSEVCEFSKNMDNNIYEICIDAFNQSHPFNNN
jgi:hypothetical protein